MPLLATVLQQFVKFFSFSFSFRNMAKKPEDSVANGKTTVLNGFPYRLKIYPSTAEIPAQIRRHFRLPTAPRGGETDSLTHKIQFREKPKQGIEEGYQKLPEW
jgi:hypothetical protein